MANTNDAIEKVPVEHLETTASLDTQKDARQATHEEHETTLWQALKSNKKAVLWSVLLSMAIVMEGYDVGQ